MKSLDKIGRMCSLNQKRPNMLTIAEGSHGFETEALLRFLESGALSFRQMGQIQKLPIIP